MQKPCRFQIFAVRETPDWSSQSSLHCTPCKSSSDTRYRDGQLTHVVGLIMRNLNFKVISVTEYSERLLVAIFSLSKAEEANCHSMRNCILLQRGI